MTRRRKRLLALGTLALPVLAYAAWAASVRYSGEAVQSGTLVDRSEEQIRASYGEPIHDRPEYVQLGLGSRLPLPPGPVRTLIFEPRGFRHPEGGTLWVWLNKREGGWVCCYSCWFRDGVMF